MFRSRPDIYTSRRSDTATVASTASPRAPPPPVTKFHSAVSATAACASSAAPVSQGMRDCPVSQSMGDCALRRSVGDGNLHLERSPQPWYGRGARASSAALPRHAPRSTIGLLLQRVALFSKGVLSLHLPAMWWRSVRGAGRPTPETPRSRLELDSRRFLVMAAWPLCPFSCQAGVHKISYLVLLSQQVYREEALPGGHFVATYTCPVSKVVYSVCRPCLVFTHDTPCARCSFGFSGTGET